MSISKKELNSCDIKHTRVNAGIDAVTVVCSVSQIEQYFSTMGARKVGLSLRKASLLLGLRLWNASTARDGTWERPLSFLKRNHQLGLPAPGMSTRCDHRRLVAGGHKLLRLFFYQVKFRSPAKRLQGYRRKLAHELQAGRLRGMRPKPQDLGHVFEIRPTEKNHHFHEKRGADASNAYYYWIFLK